MIRTDDGAAWAGDGVFWYKQDFKFQLTLLLALKYNGVTKMNLSVYSQSNLLNTVKNRVCVVNLEEYKSIGNH